MTTKTPITNEALRAIQAGVFGRISSDMPLEEMIETTESLGSVSYSEIVKP